MTPTEQAADRVKALVERLRAPDEFNNRGPDYEPMIIPPSALRLEAADALTALQARAEDAERENERLSARNLEVSTLAHGWMVAHDNLAAGLPVTYPSPADVPASLFVCALMAAAAETTYRIGFRDAERVTDERHIDYLRGNTIAGITAAMQAPDADLTARVETLQARVEELEGALKPFMPISIRMTPDYAGVEFGEHQTQAMTMDPHSWIGLNDAYGALLTPPLEQE